MATNNIYPFSSLTGGTNDGYLDYHAVAGLSDGDLAFGVVSGLNHFYTYDASLAIVADNSPYQIIPDDNASGTGAWVLGGFQGAMSHVRAHQTGAQTIPTGTTTDLTYDVEVYDTLSEFVPGTGIFTPKYSGKYLISAFCLTASVSWTASETMWLSVAIDGTTYANSTRWVLGAADTVRASSIITTVVSLLNTENLRVEITQDQGGNVDTAGSSTSVWVTIDRIV